MQLDDLRVMHRTMVLSRAIERFGAASSPHWYSGLGEEATVVGAWTALEPDDFGSPHYRGALIISWLRGRPLEQVLATIVQRQDSPARGRMYGPFAGAIELGLMPYVTYALGPNLGIAVGAALSFRLRGEPRVAMASLGDGTSTNGDFHESVNLALTQQVPCVFFCQNNGYSISTQTSQTMAAPSVSRWVAGCGIPTAEVDGNDVAEVHETVSAAVRRAREGGGPSLVEAHTYRMTGHFVGDAADYRDPHEVGGWEQRDPIVRVERALCDRGVDRGELQQVHDQTDADLALAAERVRDRAELEPSEIDLEGVIGRG